MIDLFSLQQNAENPTFIVILLTVLIAFVLGSMLAFTYEKTSRGISRPDHFIQALLLIGIVAATVMQAIGDSLAYGLGMMGALSIIRFRTTLQNPRNIVFIFASLAAGIACGVYGFVIATTGTVGFCVVAFLLWLSPFSKDLNMVGTLEFELPDQSDAINQVNATLGRHCKQHALKKYRIAKLATKGEVITYRDVIEYSYQLTLNNTHQAIALTDELKQIADVNQLKLTFRDTVVQL